MHQLNSMCQKWQCGAEHRLKFLHLLLTVLQLSIIGTVH